MTVFLKLLPNGLFAGYVRAPIPGSPGLFVYMPVRGAVGYRKCVSQRVERRIDLLIEQGASFEDLAGHSTTPCGSLK